MKLAWNDPEAAVRDQAAAWFARSRSNTMTAQERAELEAWLGASPTHFNAFAEARDLWSGLEAARADTAWMQLREEAQDSLRRRGFIRRIGELAAVVAVVLALGAGASTWMRLHDTRQQAVVASYQTRVGQTSSISLADGSLMVLDTDSAVRVLSMGPRQRRLELVRGRAFFRVAKDASRPFVVIAQGRSVTATGTQFNLYLKQSRLEVTLLEGGVRVEPASSRAKEGQRPSVNLSPGYKLVAGEEGWNIGKTDAGAESSWLQGRLIFDEATVGEIAAELNRYSDRKVIVDPAVSGRRMSAVLSSNDLNVFISAVQTLHLARSRPSASGGHELF
jgi:transmembrane sensor